MKVISSLPPSMVYGVVVDWRRSQVSKTTSYVGVGKDADTFLKGIEAAEESTSRAVADSTCDNTGKR
ncbi:hypothetical protein Tco_0523547 [Tanacetum coccineum]